MRPRRQVLRDERGGTLGCLFWLLLLGALAVVAFRFGMPYVDYLRFKDAMKGQANGAELNTDAEIRTFLVETAEGLGIPVAERDIDVRRARDTITIRTEWTREVVLPKYRRTLHFQPRVSATLTTPTP